MTSPPSTGATCGPATRSSSSFATVKLRTRVTKGAGCKKAALAMAYKLLDAVTHEESANSELLHR